MEENLIDFIVKSGAAIVAGFCMGLERQVKGKPAGLKTNTLVALGAMVFVYVSLTYAGVEFVDETRIFGQIVVGVGFLGAGVIMQYEQDQRVKGLATAATIWCSAAAGCLSAIGLYLHLLSFAVMVVIINVAFGYLNQQVTDKPNNN